MKSAGALALSDFAICSGGNAMNCRTSTDGSDSWRAFFNTVPISAVCKVYVSV